MVEELSLHGSLPDQLPIIKKSSTNTSEVPLKALPPKITLKKLKSLKLQNILRPEQPVGRRYFTGGENITEENAQGSETDKHPFEYPKDMEEFAHNIMERAWRNDIRLKELQKKVCEKPGYKERHNQNLLTRLYVKEPQLIEGKTVLNIDPNYYTEVGGRPIGHKLQIREYIETVRESLRTKIITGFREDDIMLIEETMKLEQKAIDIIKENLDYYVNTFEQFLIQDHQTAMHLLQESEFLSTQAYDKYNEHKLVAKKYAFLRSSLYRVEEKWKACKTYQKFLYNVSPLTWRIRIEESTQNRRTSIYMMSKKPDDESSIFGNYRLSLIQRGISVEDIIEEFKEEVSNDRSAQIYFTEPKQLLEVFKFIELQNLNSLLYCEEFALPLDNIKEGIHTASEMLNKEIKHLTEIIEQLERGISWEERRAEYLEELTSDLTKTELKSIIMDEEILNLYVFVEDVYEATIGPNDANISVWEMMKALEERYRHELLLLDMVPSRQVAQMENSYYQEKSLVMKLAEQAAKEHEELERLTYSMKKSFTPPPKKKTSKDLKKRSPPIKHSLKKEEVSRHLTTEEEEFLEFFTDFCEYRDNPIDYGIDPTLSAESGSERNNNSGEATKGEGRNK